MNESEKTVRNKLEKEGWDIVVGGAPDFLCIKYDKDRKIKIKDVLFVEVKPNEQSCLQHNQKIYRNVLKDFLKVNYELIYSDDVKNDSIVETLICIRCGTRIDYYGKGRKPKYCKQCAKATDLKKKRHREKKYRKLGTTHIREFSYDDFYDEYLAIKKEKIKIGLTENKCPNCFSTNIKVDNERGDIFCEDCGLVLEHFIREKSSQCLPIREQYDWNR